MDHFEVWVHGETLSQELIADGIVQALDGPTAQKVLEQEWQEVERPSGTTARRIIDGTRDVVSGMSINKINKKWHPIIEASLEAYTNGTPLVMSPAYIEAKAHKDEVGLARTRTKVWVVYGQA